MVAFLNQDVHERIDFFECHRYTIVMLGLQWMLD